MIVESPCVGICRLDDHQICIGCWRSIDEIAGWNAAADDERLRALAAAEIRRQAHAAKRMIEPRIVSFLPSATELACALGLEENLVGISHECDFPASVRGKPVIVHSALPIQTMSLGEIDVAVADRLRNGQSLYEVDLELLRELRPTHILTQDLCQVCAPAGNEVTRALNALPCKPEVVWMSPHSIADIHSDLRNLARLTDREPIADEIISRNESRLAKVRESVASATIRRVFCAEWIDPLYCCGHWVPEMLEIAGGIDPLGRKWKDSVRVRIEEVANAKPDAIIVMPCGFKLETAAEQARQLISTYRDARAIQDAEIYVADASYFSRPSLRVIDGTELLAHILHPDRFKWHGPNNAFMRIDEKPLAKTCPQCRAAFTCGFNSRPFKCWCAELPPLPKTAETSDGCLCRECLLQKLRA
jgi:iron complex transport system substrate-binding protein